MYCVVIDIAVFKDHSWKQIIQQ